MVSRSSVDKSPMLDQWRRDSPMSSKTGNVKGNSSRILTGLGISACLEESVDVEYLPAVD